MTTFDVAHIREQGQDMIIIPLNASFDLKTPNEQEDVRASLQVGARAAGLAGTVVPVWDSHGRMRFLAPRPWFPFFSSLSMAFVRANLNKRLTLN